MPTVLVSPRSLSDGPTGRAPNSIVGGYAAPRAFRSFYGRGAGPVRPGRKSVAIAKSYPYPPRASALHPVKVSGILQEWLGSR